MLCWDSFKAHIAARSLHEAALSQTLSQTNIQPFIRALIAPLDLSRLNEDSDICEKCFQVSIKHQAPLSKLQHTSNLLRSLGDVSQQLSVAELCQGTASACSCAPHSSLSEAVSELHLHGLSGSHCMSEAKALLSERLCAQQRLKQPIF